MLLWHEPRSEAVRRETIFWMGLVVLPLVYGFWIFVDYVWPWLWRVVIGAFIGITLALLVRVFYMGETPVQIWNTILSITD